MRFRSSHVRTKVVALLASLVALWGFAAFVTLRDGLNLLSVSTLDKNVGRPSESLVEALQQERRFSVVYLASRNAEQRLALEAQRSRTDRASKQFRRLAGSSDTAGAASGLLSQRIKKAFGQLDRLGRARDLIDAGSADRAQAAATFTDAISVTFRIYGALSTLDDPEIGKEGRTLIALSRAQEIFSQEDALLAGVLAAGRFTGTEPERFIELSGARRLLYDEAVAELPAADRTRYQQLVEGPAVVEFRALEQRVVEKGRVGAPLPVDSQRWKAAVDPVFTQLRDFVLEAADGTIQRAKPAVLSVIIRLLLAGVLGLIAVIASIVISITTARSLIRQIDRLRAAAWELANERLPRVVDNLSHGKAVDVAAEAPPLTFGSDEIGQVGQAFNAVQETAIRVAVEQAELRRGVRDVFLSLARRTQALVQRQLTMLDAMERREVEPADLDNLFRLDHLATRMRRNAENLIVLAGSVPGRGWRKPVPLVDVARAGVAEIEDYSRVTVLPLGSAALVGHAVGDVIHLLAELIENAASFSPPATPVQVSGRTVAKGFAFEVEDHGLGMSEVDLAVANEKLRNPPEFKLSSTARLGLFVVGRLAARHGIRVQLRESPYGGTTAIVLIPSSLVIDDPDAVAQPDRGGNGRDAIAQGGQIGDDAEQGAATVPGANAAGPARPAPASVPRPAESLPVRLADRPTEGLPTGRPADPAPPEEAAQPPAPATYTANGLPCRVRQGNLPAALLPEPPEKAAEDSPVRSPEEIRTMLASYQTATARGRHDAQRSLQPGRNAPSSLEAVAQPAEEADPTAGSHPLPDSMPNDPGDR